MAATTEPLLRFVDNDDRTIPRELSNSGNNPSAVPDATTYQRDPYDNHSSSPQPCGATPRSTFSRLWVLGMFSLTAIAQAATWNIFSPVSKTVRLAFGHTWDDTYISWATNSANIAFLLALIPTSHAIDRWGPRKVTLANAGLIAAAACARLLPLEDSPLTWRTVVVLTMLANGSSGCWLNFGGPVLSERWFSLRERTAATAVASVACYCGGALGFIIGPLTVRAPHQEEEAREAMTRLFRVEASYCVLVFLGVLAHFPDAPAVPPSATAALKHATRADASRGLSEDCPAPGVDAGPPASVKGREAGIAELLMWRSQGRQEDTRTFWTLAMCMGLPLGVFQAWSSVLALQLGPEGFSTAEASWLGCVMTLSGCCGSVAVGAAMDTFSRRLKGTTLALLAVSTASFALFAANLAGWLSPHHPTRVLVAYTTGILGGFSFNCTIPLFFEMTMETVYAWANEHAASTTLVLVNTVVQIVFLAVPTKVGGSANWMSWLMSAVLAVSVVGMTQAKVKYQRRDVDEQTTLLLSARVH